jgi:hypothetical protein
MPTIQPHGPPPHPGGRGPAVQPPQYNASMTVEAFSVRLRHEVDLDALAAEPLAVADLTMQPTTVSLPASAPGSAAWSVVSKLTRLRRDLTPCMPCSFAPCRRSRSGAYTLPSGTLEVTVTDRWIPLVTAAYPYGTRVARPARTTSLAYGGDGSQLGPRVRPPSATNASWTRARRVRGSFGGRLRYRPASWRPIA